MYETLILDRDDRGVATLTLNRPEVHNAFDDVMIGELQGSLTELDKDAGVRVVLIKAAGKSFSAGADLNWMKRAAGYSEQENYDDAIALAGMLKTLDTLSKPSLVFVHGPAYGGGVGLISCCDIALARENAVFSLSEAKLGLVPAVISPYVVRAIGVRAARRYFQSAERFGTAEAHLMGLIHGIIDAENALEPVIEALLHAGPQAQQVGKEIIARVAHRSVDDGLIQYTARTIARIRSSEEGREGVNAFLEKRESAWVKRSNDA